ncbi:RNA polymerase factor sigma-54 [Bradyrhizobium sp. DOA9]|uniref:RNA polymerase factor sigma-54 n=1 Tax=Bradyrhizobium sp. DOA9 TaxID=1126627 RepID=UPI00049987C6|nr:RNA polymerase factor sigma-54 [Bradyrhizobium sp. DOA9]GAJ37709.1 RNA polymerase sigma-54 factor 2 [Bradyrhizobium sp. DOA9]
MSHAYQQEFRQSQSVVISPALQHSIKLLHLSNLDLASFVEQELERNPLLEQDRDMPARDDAGMTSGCETSGSSELADEPRNVETDDLPSQPSAEAIAQDAEGDGPRAGGDLTGSRSSEQHYDLEEFVSAETTLRDHLNEQLGLALTSPTKRAIGHYLIDLVDEAGYLPQDLGQAAETLGVPRADVDEVLAILQEFDPSGVCARSLSECLAIQLRGRDRYDPAMQALVANLHVVPQGIAALRSVCGVSDEDIADMIAEIRGLSPKPGHQFGAPQPEALIPDVLVRRSPDNDWVVELNSEAFPNVCLKQDYHRKLASKLRSHDDKSYLANAWTNARWLTKSLEHRANTILTVASEIVRQQRDFFTCGIEHLRPLNLKAVAEATGLHESTVSRATTNKYLASNRGRLELKYFFTPSVASVAGGTAHSAEAVRHRIKRLIDCEDPLSVLSDDAIVELLRASGIDIARRTIAKYRDILGIPSSMQRRRQKQAAPEYVLTTAPTGPTDNTETARVEQRVSNGRLPVLQVPSKTIRCLGQPDPRPLTSRRLAPSEQIRDD